MRSRRSSMFFFFMLYIMTSFQMDGHEKALEKIQKEECPVEAGPSVESGDSNKCESLKIQDFNTQKLV